MRFTCSKDGTMRASVRVTHRVDVAQLVEALALEIIETPDRAVELSRTQIEQVLRDRLTQDGEGAHWTEFGPEYEPYAEAVEAATRRVAECFPGVS